MRETADEAAFPFNPEPSDLLDHSRLLRSAGISSGSGGPGNSQPEFLGIPAMTHEEMSRKGVTASLRRTSDTIRDIEVFLSGDVTCDAAV